MVKKKSIVVVEDEGIVALDIQKILEDMGYDVPAIINSGEKAIKKVEEIKPDLVLMDIMLSGKVDGIDVANEITSCFHIPVVYLTAYGSDKLLNRAKVTEPFGYIMKPFKERELKATLEMAFYKAKMESKLRKSKEELAVKVKELSILNRKKTDFLNMVSHGLRTPIAVISSTAELCIATSKLNKSEKKRCTKIFEGERERLETIMTEINIANQQSQQEISYKFKELNLDDLINELKAVIMPFLKIRDQKLIMSVKDKSLFVKADKLRLFDALFGIVENASKFSEDEKRIFVILIKEKDKDVIEIEDQGIGIREDTLNVIFEPFYEAKDIRLHYSGDFEFKSSRLGMGLYITKNIVEKHGGEITVASTLGKGSKFSIMLPLTRILH